MDKRAPFYILDANHLALPCFNVHEWAEWFADISRRRVAVDGTDECRVSTVFLGLDHSWSDEGDPLLFETMVFLDGTGGQMARYSTWAEAVAGHERIVGMLAREKLDAEHITIKILRDLLKVTP